MAKSKKKTKTGAKKKTVSKGKKLSVAERDISRVYKLMKEENLLEVSWQEKDGISIRVRRAGGATAVAPQPEVPSAAPAGGKPVKEKTCIRSPMNGIFYRAPSPGSDPYVAEGDEISSGATVCVIEAMKLMNEVQVENPCRIVKAIAENAAPVKVNDPLFEIENL